MKENITLLSNEGILTLERLCQIINEGFGEPFLVSGGVVAEIHSEGEDKWLTLSIGRRDVSFTNEGDIWSTGTFMSMSNNTLLKDDYLNSIL